MQLLTVITQYIFCADAQSRACGTVLEYITSVVPLSALVYYKKIWILIWRNYFHTLF